MTQLTRQPFYRQVNIYVRDVAVHGAKARARVLVTAGSRREPDTYSLVKQEGRWRIDAFGAQHDASR